MKLGELRTTIRKTKGNPVCTVVLPDGTQIPNVGVQKSSLHTALEGVYGSKATETGLWFDTETMTFVKDGETPGAAEQDADSLDDESLEDEDLGDDDTLGDDDDTLDDDDEL